MKNKISIIGAVAGSVLPFISLAQSTIPGPQNPQLPGITNVSFGTVSTVFCTIAGWFFTLLLLLAIIYILWAAYNYLTSNGDEEKIKKANHQLFYAAIAIIVAILARGAPFFISAMTGNPSGIQGCG